MKIRNFFVLGLIGLLIGISSCRDDLDFDISSGNLSFSNDTLNLDTIFNFTNSQTYKLTVHNNQDEDVVIPRIYLTNGESSLFKLNVDGMPGNEIHDVAIRKNDSIFIFVEIGAGEVLNNSIYEDEINFETSGNNQQVKLLSYLEKAKFYNTELNDNYSLTETNWNNEWSRVIFGNVNAGNLNIDAGTRIYFHSDANLTINGNLNVTGNIDQKVIFRSDRMDERSDSIPDSWGKILLQNSADSHINYAIIRNGNIGLQVENSTLDILNTRIENNQEIGLYAIKSTVKGRNLVINNADNTTLGLEGGTYDFRHCTFANYFNVGQGAGGNYSLVLSNESDLDAKFFNSIFYGIASNAIYFDEENNSGSESYEFDYNVIRGEVPSNFQNTISEDPMFVESEDLNNDLRLLNDSPVLGNANYLYIQNDPLSGSLDKDILNDTRPTNSDGLNPGAYQNPANPED